MKESGDTYLAVWQDGVPDPKGVIAPQPAREVEVSTSEIPDGNYSLQILDLNGSSTSSVPLVITHSLNLKITLPEISASTESGIYLAKLTTSSK